MARDIILLVEDSADDAALALRALEQHRREDPEVVVARDGLDALAYVFATGAHAGRDPNHLPVLVLLDLKLPKMDGLEVLHRLRANPLTAAVPVVIFTSSNEIRDIRAAYASGVNSFVRKPVEFNKFRDTVRTLVHYWLVLNERAQAAG